MAGKNKTLFFLIYLVIGLYMINYPFQFLKIPESISIVIDKWIILIGGALLIIGGINYLRLSKYSV